MKIKIIFGCFLAVCMLVILPSVSTVEINTSVKTDEVCELNNDIIVLVKDIKFGFRKIIATVENLGNESTITNVTFWIHAPPIISPRKIGQNTVNIQAGDTIDTVQEFRYGVGVATFYVSLNDADVRDSYSTRGFWFFFFGIELPIIK